MSSVEVKEAPAPVATTSPMSESFTDLDSWLHHLMQKPFFGRFPNLLSAFDGVDFTPLADIEETDTGWTVEVELPGIAKKDIEVEAQGHTIVISGERKEKERTGVLRQRRRVTGTFRYEVTLGADFDADGITADLADGELTVTVPKAEADQPRRIKVT